MKKAQLRSEEHILESQGNAHGLLCAIKGGVLKEIIGLLIHTEAGLIELIAGLMVRVYVDRNKSI